MAEPAATTVVNLTLDQLQEHLDELSSDAHERVTRMYAFALHFARDYYAQHEAAVAEAKQRIAELEQELNGRKISDAAKAMRIADLEAQLFAAEQARSTFAERAAASAGAVKIAATDYKEAQQALQRRDSEIADLRAQLRRRIEGDAALLASLNDHQAHSPSSPSSSSSSSPSSSPPPPSPPRALKRSLDEANAAAAVPPRRRRRGAPAFPNREDIIDLIEKMIHQAAVDGQPATSVTARDVLVACAGDGIRPLPSRRSVSKWIGQVGELVRMRQQSDAAVAAASAQQTLPSAASSPPPVAVAAAAAMDVDGGQRSGRSQAAEMASLISGVAAETISSLLNKSAQAVVPRGNGSPP